MRTRRSIAVAGSIILLGVLGAAMPDAGGGADLRTLDRRAQGLKSKALALNAELLRLAEAVLHPADTRMNVFLTVRADAPFRLDTVELHIDDRVVSSHRYTDAEMQALVRGGVQRLHTANVPAGEHELSLIVAGKNESGREYRRTAAMIFHKQDGPKVLELAVVNTRGRDAPELHAPMLVRDHLQRQAQDPYFGETLFELYVGRYFSALTHLMLGREVGLHPLHEHEAAMLLADLYLAHGLHGQADRIYGELINGGRVPVVVAARAELKLARSWYERGYFDAALDALLRIRDTLPQELQEERRVLLALALMRRNRFGEAVAVLSQLRGNSDWATYARYNMGVGLIQIDRRKEGVATLEKVTRVRADTNAMKALRDKANLALGFAFLSSEDPERARSYFREVRLSGPYASRALLGIGWALSAKGKHKQSLAPWLELQERKGFDIALQESLLATGYAFAELQAYEQALAHYQQAITVYDAEIARIGETVATLRSDRPLEQVLFTGAPGATDTLLLEERLGAVPENRYLVRLYASHDFQEALRAHRSLQSLAQNLECWARVLANEAELSERLQQARAAAAPAAGDREPPDDMRGCAALNAPRNWGLASDYSPTLWVSADPLAPVGQDRAQSLQDGQEGSAEDRATLALRAAALQRRVSLLGAEVQAAAAAQEQYLKDLVVAELEHQQERLRAYVTQARFGIAQVYDRSLTRATKAQ